MPTTIHWQTIALRLLCTVIAGTLIGIDRGEHGRPAGLRTTLLVCLAASVAMIQANLLMDSTGRAQNSYVVLDLMRLPLGILSGMGFIGAGAILRKDNLVMGVTTAATIWFVTVMGLCFGGGQIGLGFAALILALGVLSVLKRVDQRMPQDHHAALILSLAENGPDDDEVRSRIECAGFLITSYAFAQSVSEKRRELRVEVLWSAPAQKPRLPRILKDFAQCPGVLKLEWKP